MFFCNCLILCILKLMKIKEKNQAKSGLLDKTVKQTL